MRVLKTDSVQARRFESFFLPHVAESNIFNDCIFYLACDESTEEIIGAAAVYPALVGARLLSISVSEGRERQYIGTRMLKFISEDLWDVYLRAEAPVPRIIVSECLIGDEWDILDSFLLSNGFELKDTDPFVSVNLKDIADSQILRSAGQRKIRGRIVPLKDVDRQKMRVFSNQLVKGELFPTLDIDSLDPDLSMLYTDNDKIVGCILMSRKDDMTVMNEWVYLSNEVPDRTVLLVMLSRCAVASLKHVNKQAKLWFLPVNEVSVKLFSKIFPNEKHFYEIREYEKLLL